ncbi:hypothetical protein P43SY_000757 [Pythium insidiosum]|uniref:Transcription initiation factor TFIID subunit n=1 Tax=Pythium insidiosum TaxID=114742 RepID=A0AAD5Q6R1_PYTIN|nr:hypothetical protein P43SY_000757 [Pythium insidiosum]
MPSMAIPGASAKGAKSTAASASSKSNGSASEAAAKAKHAKAAVAEDAHAGGDTAASETDEPVLPLDAVAMKELLASMGADRHEPRVVSQLHEFVHRYVTEILVDAQEYSLFASKTSVDVDDVRLAIASRLNHHYTNVPSRELLIELAEKRNSLPLPPISNEYGVRLPPPEHQLVTFERDRYPDEPRSPGSQDEMSGYDEPMPLARLEGTRNKKMARQQTPYRDHETPSFLVEDFLASLFRPQDAFVHAASLNQLDVVQRWISRRHDVNERDQEGRLALCAASQNRCLDVLSLLLASDAHVNLPERDGKTALHIACMWGRLDAATILLQHGADPTRKDLEGQLPLHAACRNGHDSVVELLLRCRPDVFVADDCGSTPMELARDWQRREIMVMLQEYVDTELRPSMRARVRFVVKYRCVELPQSIQAEICSFLC